MRRRSLALAWASSLVLAWVMPRAQEADAHPTRQRNPADRAADRAAAAEDEAPAQTEFCPD